MLSLSRGFQSQQNSSLHRICDESYNDNIGYQSYYDSTCFPRIDAVYTWVNGSDPIWFAEMQRYKTQYRKEHNITDVEEDASISLNRFRDNDELKYDLDPLFHFRYSLRSLEKNAPWIHHIYIVTNGQIPSWLDTSNPKVTIVTHKEIFTNPKALPTFSSPSIEMNLHHIHGLSDYFIYFNDDVFLGSPVLPADFMTLEKGQILYSSWEVPECSKLCKYSMLNNNVCDSACNNRECGFDLGDCANVTPVESKLSKQEEAIIAAKEEEQCNSACDQSLLENDQCDEVCNTVECGYDRGLCRSSLTNHYNLTFFCRVEDSLNLTKSLRLHPRDISDADYFVEKEYTLETTSYCVARMIVHQTHFIILHIDPILSAHFSIQTINCLEPGFPQIVFLMNRNDIDLRVRSREANGFYSV